MSAGAVLFYSGGFMDIRHSIDDTIEGLAELLVGKSAEPNAVSTLPYNFQDFPILSPDALR